MRRRHAMSVVALFLFAPTTVRATEPVARSGEFGKSPNLHDSVVLKLNLGCFDGPSETDSFLNAVTMRELPPGSLYVTYDGLHGVVVKHLRSQFRRFTRQAAREGWMVRQDDDDTFRALHERLAHTPADARSNGHWWHRSWLDSLPEEKGGAPTVPYVHTYGSETSWEFGPVTVTNTLKVKFDYIAFFEINPEPISHDHSRKTPRVTLDVRSIRAASFGTQFTFDIKPKVSIGMPNTSGVMSALRYAALQGNFVIRHSGHKLIEGQAEVRWDPREGFVVSVEVSLVSW